MEVLPVLAAAQILLELEGLAFSFNAMRNGSECEFVFCGDKWEINDCTAKADGWGEEGDEVLGGAEMCFDFANDPPVYQAFYSVFEEDVEVCGGLVYVNLEDAPDSKYVCEDDAQFTLKVDCPEEEDD